MSHPDKTEFRYYVRYCANHNGFSGLASECPTCLGHSTAAHTQLNEPHSVGIPSRVCCCTKLPEPPTKHTLGCPSRAGLPCKCGVSAPLAPAVEPEIPATRYPLSVLDALPLAPTPPETVEKLRTAVIASNGQRRHVDALIAAVRAESSPSPGAETPESILAVVDRARNWSKAPCPFCRHPWPSGATMQPRPVHSETCDPTPFLRSGGSR